MNNCQREFEVWADNYQNMPLDKDRIGEYYHPIVNTYWYAWKSAWALAFKLGQQNSLQPICEQLKIETPEDWDVVPKCKYCDDKKIMSIKTGYQNGVPSFGIIDCLYCGEKKCR